MDYLFVCCGYLREPGGGGGDFCESVCYRFRLSKFISAAFV